MDFSPSVILLIAVVGAWAIKELYVNYKNKNDKSEEVIDLKFDNVHERVGRVETDFNTHKEEQPINYVRKDDFYREVNKLERKMDEHQKLTMEVNSAVNEIVGMMKADKKE